MPSQSKYGIGTSYATTELTLPSRGADGEPNVVLVRRLDPQALLASGFADKLDVLTALVDQTHIAPKQNRKSRPSQALNVRTGDSPDEQADLLKTFIANKGDISVALGLMDWLVEFCVVEPEVRRPVKTTEEGKEVPLPLREREAGVIYTDTVDLDDKNAVMAFALGGVESLKPFRKGRNKSVVDLATM